MVKARSRRGYCTIVWFTNKLLDSSVNVVVDTLDEEDDDKESNHGVVKVE